MKGSNILANRGLSYLKISYNASNNVQIDFFDEIFLLVFDLFEVETR